MSLFEHPCMNYLSGKQCENGCRYSHVLPGADKVFFKMLTFPDDKIFYIYKEFIVKSRVSFELYFPMVCRLMSERKRCATLAAFVPDCEGYEKYDFLGCIFLELVQCDMTKSDALMMIVNRRNIRSASDEVIIKIIEDDPASFIDILHRYAKQLTPDIVQKLMAQISLDPTLKLKCDIMCQKYPFLGERILDLMEIKAYIY